MNRIGWAGFPDQRTATLGEPSRANQTDTVASGWKKELAPPPAAAGRGPSGLPGRSRWWGDRPVVLLALAVCGLTVTPAAGLEPVRSLLELRRDRVVVQGYDISCGAAALATLLTYQHGDPVPEQEIANGLIRREEYLENPELVRARQGFSLLDLKRFVEGRGYNGRGFGQVTLKELLALAPAIVPVRLKGYEHFVVFRGMSGNRVLLADPAWGNRTLRVERFTAAWLDSTEFGRVAFIVERPDGTVPPNRLAPRPVDFVR